MSRGDHAPSHAKNDTVRQRPINTALVARVEEKMRSYNEHVKGERWEFDKKKTVDRTDMIRLARNLDTMLRQLPRGAVGSALEAAGFGGNGAEVHGFRGNVAISPNVIDVDKKRLARLTPVAHRYINVALHIESARDRALAGLFAGTSFDSGPDAGSDRDWADRLADALAVVAARVAVQTELGPLFDRLSRENVHVAEDFGAEGMLDERRTPELRLTEWLSETFHKTAFTGQDPHAAVWYFDRNDESTPLCGAPLFCPKLCITRAEFDWDIDLSGPGPAAPATLRTVVRDFLALVPIAETLETPARVEPWLLRRPEAFLRIGNLPESRVVQIALQDDGKVRLLYGGDARSFDSALATLPDALLAHWAVALFLDTGKPVSDSPDLAGCWQARPATAEHLRSTMGAVLVEGVEIVQLTSPVQHGDLSRVIGNSDGPEMIDRHAVVPAIYAPWGSAAAALQNAEPDKELHDGLTEAVARLAAGNRELHHRLVTGCPIAESMLRFD